VHVAHVGFLRKKGNGSLQRSGSCFGFVIHVDQIKAYLGIHWDAQRSHAVGCVHRWKSYQDNAALFIILFD
jgi:hypothetical protein